MATSVPVSTIVPQPGAIPASLLNVCFVLGVINAAFFPAAFFAHWWIFNEHGLGIPTDFVNVWSAGRLVLDGHPALAYDWDIQKQVQVAVLGQDYDGNFAWHYRRRSCSSRPCWRIFLTPSPLSAGLRSASCPISRSCT